MQMKEFFDADTPQYAILSHTWQNPQDEVSYADFQSKVKQNTSGYKKILDCITLARTLKVQWIWIDTCCIQATSSAELSEAINSMYAWYRDSHLCFTLLSDLRLKKVDPGLPCTPAGQDPTITSKPTDQTSGGMNLLPQLQDCSWFTRGWTLQELLAPRIVLFFDADLKYVGDRNSLATCITAITGIDEKYLWGWPAAREASVAQRMSWLSRRTTSRSEDMAYCMLGLFNVNLPLLYGEGGRAFGRLQEHIILSSSDESIFAWRSDSDRPRGLLADHAKEFSDCADIVVTTHHEDSRTEVTSRGIELTRGPKTIMEFVVWSLGMMPVPTFWRRLTYVLACEDASTGRAITIKLSTCKPYRNFPNEASIYHHARVVWYRVDGAHRHTRRKSPYNFMARTSPLTSTKLVAVKGTGGLWDIFNVPQGADKHTLDRLSRLWTGRGGLDTNIDGFLIVYFWAMFIFGSIFYATKTRHSKDVTLVLLLLPIMGPILGLTHPALPTFYFMLVVELFRRDYLPQIRTSRKPAQTKDSECSEPSKKENTEECQGT